MKYANGLLTYIHALVLGSNAAAGAKTIGPCFAGASQDRSVLNKAACTCRGCWGATGPAVACQCLPQAHSLHHDSGCSVWCMDCLHLVACNPRMSLSWAADCRVCLCVCAVGCAPIWTPPPLSPPVSEPWGREAGLRLCQWGDSSQRGAPPWMYYI